MKKNNDWKDRLGVVFSTNPDFAYQDEDQQPMDSLAPGQQKLRLRIEKNGRGGKTVTVVCGFVGKEEELKELARMLKTRCGVGGSCKEGEIIIPCIFDLDLGVDWDYYWDGDVMYCKPGILLVRLNGEYGYIDLEGNSTFKGLDKIIDWVKQREI